MTALELDLTTRDAASLLDLTPRRLQQLVAENIVPKTSRGRHPLVGTVQGYIRNLRDEVKRTSRTAAASRMHDAKARQLEMRIAREANELIDLQEALAVVDDIIATYRLGMDSLATRVTRDLDLRDTIEAEVRRTYEGVSAVFAKKSEELRTPKKASR